MSPCCVAAATATAVTTTVVVAGLSVFVLTTDGVGLALFAGLATAGVLRAWDAIPASPSLWYALSAALALRAAWLLSTSRRGLVVSVWNFAKPRAVRLATRVFRGVGLRTFNEANGPAVPRIVVLQPPTKT